MKNAEEVEITRIGGKRKALKQNREKYADQIEIDVLHIIVLGWNSHEKAFHLVTIIAVFAIEIVIFERN